MAADPDSFEDDCPGRSDDGTTSILSGEASDDSDDPEEVQSLLTTIQRTRAEQTRRIHNPVGSTGDESATVLVSFCL